MMKIPGPKKTIKTNQSRILKEDVIETEIDDMNPQFCNFVKLELYKHGAVDVEIMQHILKKERPGIRIRIVCPKELTEHLARVLFEQTTTFGVKINNTHAMRLHVQMQKVGTRYGPVTVKVGSFDGKVLSVSPEYEDAKVIAQKAGAPLKEVFVETMCNYRKLQEKTERKKK
ncbi:DUF111 family protein [Candidatus Woesearchaeota archaeon]|nr:DUF111 family protein [Candidatus Woesearchaeota archaeon]